MKENIIKWYMINKHRHRTFIDLGKQSYDLKQVDAFKFQEEK